MGWKGGPCFYCRADLDRLMNVAHSDPGSDELAELFRRRAEWCYEEFERHMQASCIADPQTLDEWKAVIHEAWAQVEYERDKEWERELR